MQNPVRMVAFHPEPAQVPNVKFCPLTRIRIGSDRSPYRTMLRNHNDSTRRRDWCILEHW
jgi:hypothetical protein